MSAPPEQEEPDRYCPSCGVAYEPTQEYCLECGARLPVNRGVVGVLASAWQRRFAWYPGDWIWPTLLFLLLTIAATSVALAAHATDERSRPTLVRTDTPVAVGPGATPTNLPVTTATATLPAVSNSPTITTGPLPEPPGTGTATGVTPPATPPPSNPNALATWPANKSGYTVVLESLPVSNGRAAAVARARQAKAKGLADVGVLESAQYSSLHAGYFVVFAGIYATASQAAAAVASAHSHGFPDAFQRQVTR